MKKTYVIPSVEVIKVNSTAILAASINKDPSGEDFEVDTDVEQQGRDDIPSSPNIWDQQW